MYGAECLFFVGGVEFGDFSDTYCCLWSACTHLSWIASATEPLWDNTFDNLTPEQIHDFVRNVLYGEDWQGDEEEIAKHARYRRFDFLTGWGEPFDWFGSVIVQPTEGMFRVMHKPATDAPSGRRLSGRFLTAECTSSGFKKAANDFVDWYGFHLERLRST